MKYQLKCLKTGDLINDAYTLHYTDNALLRAVYNEPFERQNNAEGVWKYLRGCRFPKPTTMLPARSRTRPTHWASDSD